MVTGRERQENAGKSHMAENKPAICVSVDQVNVKLAACEKRQLCAQVSYGGSPGRHSCKVRGRGRSHGKLLS